MATKPRDTTPVVDAPAVENNTGAQPVDKEQRAIDRALNALEDQVGALGSYAVGQLTPHINEIRNIVSQ